MMAIVTSATMKFQKNSRRKPRFGLMRTTPCVWISLPLAAYNFRFPGLTFLEMVGGTTDRSAPVSMRNLIWLVESYMVNLLLWAVWIEFVVVRVVVVSW